MTNQTNDPRPNDVRKAELLAKTVKHIDIKSFDARPMSDSAVRPAIHRDTARFDSASASDLRADGTA